MEQQATLLRVIETGEASQYTAFRAALGQCGAAVGSPAGVRVEPLKAQGRPGSTVRPEICGRSPWFSAEGAGFEPANELPRCRFSRPMHSTALPPLRRRPSF